VHTFHIYKADHTSRSASDLHKQRSIIFVVRCCFQRCFGKLKKAKQVRQTSCSGCLHESPAELQGGSMLARHSCSPSLATWSVYLTCDAFFRERLSKVFRPIRGRFRRSFPLNINRSNAKYTTKHFFCSVGLRTSQLMKNFYQALARQKDLQGSNKSEALREASLTLLKDRRYRHPFYWAGFVLVSSN
jgi:hypothetical protein